MSNLVNLSFIDFGPARVIGKKTIARVEGAENPIPQFWMKCLEDGTLQVLESMPSYILNPAYIGWEGEYDPNTQEFSYIVGMLMKPDTPIPEGFDFRDLPSCKMAIGWIKGKEPEIYMDGVYLILSSMRDLGFEYDESAGYMIEVYTYERFVMPQERGEDEVILDLYIPCKNIEVS
ncbi:GyrI-like domain-containing protein [bacterium]|nr:GyrI-like domain-containing protein [bacterium]